MKWNVERGSMERLYIMKKILAILVLGLLLSGNAFAKKNKNTWDYPLLAYKGWEIKGSDNHYKFK